MDRTLGRVAGIDGCRDGWIAVTLDDRGAAARFLASIAEVDALGDLDAIGIDIPLRFPISGRRASEVAGRAALGPRRSSLFFTPVRAAIDAPTHAAACDASRAAGDGGISQQVYRLGPKIREVGGWLGGPPCPVFEVHPELSFASLLGAPALHSKRTPDGQTERRAALAAAGIELPNVIRPGKPDDLLDAAVCAWTARRIVANTATPYPSDPSGDDAIWA